MKKFNKLFIILLCFVGAMSVTSCLNSDGDGGIDPETYKAWLSAMYGPYYGSSSDYRYQNKIFYYYDDEEENKIKTDYILGVVVNINSLDTAFTVSNATGRVLAKQIPDTYKDLRDALESYDQPISINGKFDFTGISQNAYFTIYNTSATINNLEYGGETHDITVAFWGYPYSSGAYGRMGEYDIIEIYLCLGAIFIDDSQTPLFEYPISSQADLTKATLFLRATRS